MRYVIYTLFLSCLIFSTIWAYRINYETRDVVKRIQRLQYEIAVKESELLMLEGEWAYLNRPDRLSLLAEKFFHRLFLMPISSENYAAMDSLKVHETDDPKIYPIEEI